MSLSGLPIPICHMWLRFEWCDPDGDVDSSQSCHQMVELSKLKIRFKHSMQCLSLFSLWQCWCIIGDGRNSFVDTLGEQGEYFCWCIWGEGWILLLKQLSWTVDFYVEAVGKKAEFGEVGKFLCWCIWGVNLAVNLGQSRQINERCKWIASAWPILSSPATKYKVWWCTWERTRRKLTVTLETKGRAQT